MGVLGKFFPKFWAASLWQGSFDYWGHPAGTGFSLSVRGECKVGKRRAEKHVLLFEKLLLIPKKKDAKHCTYKGHILVSPSPASVLLCVCVRCSKCKAVRPCNHCTKFLVTYDFSPQSLP